MNTNVLSPKVRAFLIAHLKEDVSKLVLKGSPFKDITTQELAQQFVGLQKSKTKLNTWFKTANVLFPPKVNIEQTSSEITANYKASLIKGQNFIDITGGFGVDTFYFSKVFKTLTHCEYNKDLSKLAQHNAKAFNVSHINFINEDGIDYLKNTSQTFDCIYSDPSRRDISGGKVFKLSDCQPNIPKHLELLFSKSKTVLIKTSPLLDITLGLKELKAVSSIHIIAINNDVKELLWVLHPNKKKKPVTIKTINITSSSTQEFSADITHSTADDILYTLPQKYLYEPNAALMKSGLFTAIGLHYSVGKLHKNSHLYTSKHSIDFPGRQFKLLECIPFQKQSLKKTFKHTKANITTRNFPMTVSQLKTALQIKDGGAIYLFFTTTIDNKKVCLKCEKI